MLTHEVGGVVARLGTSGGVLPPGWDDVPLSELLAEPDQKAPIWYPACYARIIAISRGLVLHLGSESNGDHLAWRARLDRARVPRISALSDLDRVRKAQRSDNLDRLAKLDVGIGSPHPDVVLVGIDNPKGDRYPFYSCSGLWMMRSLRLLGYDEMTLYLTNAKHPRGPKEVSQRDRLKGLFDLLSPWDPTWVGLGDDAHRTLRGIGIPHVEAKHPAWHRRFKHSEGPEGYANHLETAGLDLGRWDPEGDPLPTNPCGLAAPKLSPMLLLGSSVAFKVEGAKKKGGTRIGPERLDRARKAYVTGVDDVSGKKVRTYTQAAKLIGAHVDDVRGYGKEQRWPEEKERHRAKARARAYDDSIEVNAKAVSRCRKLAWTGTTLALASITRRLQQGEINRQKGETLKAGDTNILIPSTADAERLERISVVLSDLTDPRSEAESERLRALPLPDLAAELNQTLKDAFGIDPTLLAKGRDPEDVEREADRLLEETEAMDIQESIEATPSN